MSNRFSADRKLILKVQPDERRVSPGASEEATKSIRELEISNSPASVRAQRCSSELSDSSRNPLFVTKCHRSIRDFWKYRV